MMSVAKQVMMMRVATKGNDDEGGKGMMMRVANKDMMMSVANQGNGDERFCST